MAQHGWRWPSTPPEWRVAIHDGTHVLPCFVSLRRKDDKEDKLYWLINSTVAEPLSRQQLWKRSWTHDETATESSGALSSGLWLWWQRSSRCSMTQEDNDVRGGCALPVARYTSPPSIRRTRKRNSSIYRQASSSAPPPASCWSMTVEEELASRRLQAGMVGDAPGHEVVTSRFLIPSIRMV